jgi:hypothetical protein
VFDEMSGMQKTEIEAFKRIITSDYNSYRPLYTMELMRVKQNCTFIGISNKSLSENIYDPTGLRRFLEVKCLDQFDRELLKSVNALEIWQSIDESLDRGYIEPILDILSEHQSNMLVMDELQHFLDANEVLPLENRDQKEIAAIAIHRAYEEWRLVNGYKSKDGLIYNSFCIRLSRFKMRKSNKRIDGEKKTTYFINSDALFLRTPAR